MRKIGKDLPNKPIHCTKPFKQSRDFTVDSIPFSEKYILSTKNLMRLESIHICGTTETTMAEEVLQNIRKGFENLFP